MNKPFSKLLSVLLLGICFLPAITYAQTTITPHQMEIGSTVGAGARAFGMGGAFIAIADDATAASWNVGALAQLEKPELSIVYSANRSPIYYPDSLASALVKDVGPSPKQVQVRLSEYNILYSGKSLDFLSFTLPIRTQRFKFVSQIHYQRVINLSWNYQLKEPRTGISESFQDKSGNPVILKTRDRLKGNSSGGFDIISTSLAFRLSPQISMGTSLNIWRGKTASNQTYSSSSNIVPAEDPAPGIVSRPGASMLTQEIIDVNSEMSGFNFNLGVLLKASDLLNIGLVYKTPFTLKNQSDLKKLKDGGLDPSKSYTHTGDLKYPYTYGIGFAIHPTDQLTMAMDYSFTNWSEGHEKNINRLYTNRETRYIARQPFPLNASDSEGRPHDTRQFRLGTEYVFLYNSLLLPARVGFFINTPYTTDANNKTIFYKGFSLGTGICFHSFLLDLAYVSQNGSSPYYVQGQRKYESHQLYASAIYRFNLNF